ncbi:MAG: glutathione S-transferase family protein [Brevundimonas sp.]|uniref:glutathione S-transferase family protein n=1 Tax=Brevundimonas sp. TaxID=1871086 RepID=UPI0025B8FB84|nr:glutathione S-transferase family protein [Brevundimonas sp.]MBX3477871.1 glutathione S-transferase family protein [Brevundimonas sp.]
MASATLIGSPVSPYVRKVLAACAVKGVTVAVDPITPFMGNDGFSRISPLRRIPVWIEDDFILNDSSAIVQYIEETRPGPSLWPADPRDRARARWLEEYGDTRLFDVLGWKLFFQIALKPRFFGGETDQAVVAHARDVELPEILDYLESVSAQDGFLFGEEPGVADFAVTAACMNLEAIRVRVDPARWPRFAGLIARVQDTPLGNLNRLAGRLMRTPVEQHREVLPEFGLAPTETTLLGREARRGPMTAA